ncbi:hypothetical protein ACFPRL_26885 [Pseudoclavibacter helvolus]
MRRAPTHADCRSAAWMLSARRQGCPPSPPRPPRRRPGRRRPVMNAGATPRRRRSDASGHRSGCAPRRSGFGLGGRRQAAANRSAR